MFETLTVALFLIMLNIVFAIKPHPIMGITINIITFFIGVSYFVTDTTLPMNTPNPIFTVMILILAGASAVCQVKDYSKPH